MSEPRVDVSCASCFDARSSLHRLEHELARLVRENEGLRDVLAEVEWSATYGGTEERCCPVCRGAHGAPHWEGCALAAALGRGR